MHDESPWTDEALIAWERSVINRQSDESIQIDALPFELYQLIQISRAELRDTGHLSARIIDLIARAFGPGGSRLDQTLTYDDLIARPEYPDAWVLAIGRRDQTQPRTIGHRRRIHLALLTVEHALPIWDARYKAGPQILLVLARARRTLAVPWRYPNEQIAVREFWEWWLITAIPQAWQQGGVVDE
jgi:hypothetical protein